MSFRPSRRRLMAASGAWAAAAWPDLSTGHAAMPQKVLRYALRAAETGFDPAQIADVYSRIITSHIFEAPCAYDPLARPVKIKPLTAAALPAAAADHRVWTLDLRPGIYFADDPAFGGSRRELVAQDYVYTFQRIADPRWKSPAWSALDDYHLVGLAEARQRALDHRLAFDYEAPIAGLRAMGRYRLRFELRHPRPRFAELLTDSSLFGAVAREVVERYGDHISEHPVGTGPFKLTSWRRSSLIVLDRNAGYRERVYDAEPGADDAQGQAWLARLKGRRLPMVDRVEVSIIEASQPRWLSFVNGQHNLVEQVPPEFIPQAMPNGRLAPYLARRGVQALRSARSDVYATLFNMDDPVVGGYSPDKVALRRAIGLGLDVAREIRLANRGQGLIAQSPISPYSASYDPTFKSEMGDHDPARAQALLDLYGYLDRNGDGWREQPDGAPLVLQWSIENTAFARQLSELFEHDMKVLGLKVQFRPGPWPELFHAAQSGHYMIWHYGNQASSPDSIEQLSRYDGQQIGGTNLARFRRPEFDALYAQLDVLPDGPEREALFHQARRMAVAWMPYKARFHSTVVDMAQPEVIGYRRPLFWQDWWQYVDIDLAAERDAATQSRHGPG